MEYLLIMSFSGSTMMGIYFLLKYLLKDKASSRLYYLLIKEVILFFLIPLHFLKGWYGKIIWTAMLKGQRKGVHIPLTWTQYAVHTGEKTFINSFAIIQMVVAAAWLLVVCVLMARILLKYYRIRQMILRNESTEITENQQSFLAEIKKQYGVKRSVILCQGQEGNRTMTFGVCRPVIICDRKIDSWEAEIHIRHEMVHIKRLDALWKILIEFVVILHWWNPIAWMMRREFDRVCEYSCDEIVMQGKTREEVKAYLCLLIDEVCAASETKTASISWQNHFANDMDNMKKRMENVMKKKKWNRYVAGMLMAVLAFANSMTVFAYRDTFHQEVSVNVSPEEVTEHLNVDDFSFMPDGVEEPAVKMFEPLKEMKIVYDKQFVDEEGEIYPYSEEETITTYRSCSHDFASGTANEHTKYSDGSCKVIVYRAQRCDICGYVIRGEVIKTVTYTVCPH